MARLIDAAQEVVSFLLEKEWPCCIVGGMAVPRWGEPRATVDVDVCLFTGLGDEASFVGPILGQFAARVPDANAFAIQNRVLLITASNGVDADIALGWTPFETSMINRASLHHYTQKISLPTASAEDVVITKAFANRPQDWVDVNGVLVKQRGNLDWDYIRRELAPLCELKEAPEIMDQLDAMRVKIDAE
jgi:hypothetical protein